MAGPYCLKKDSYCAIILNQLLNDDTFADVTLTTEGKSIKAHRIVLSLSSSYFERVLCKDPLIQNAIVFHGISFSELKNIIQFIYMGEVIVDADAIQSFMHTAEILEITSLCGNYEHAPNNYTVIPNQSKEISADSYKITSDISGIHPGPCRRKLIGAPTNSKDSSEVIPDEPMKTIKMELIDFSVGTQAGEKPVIPVDSEVSKRCKRKLSSVIEKPSISDPTVEESEQWGSVIGGAVKENETNLPETFSNTSESFDSEQWIVTEKNSILSDSTTTKNDIVSSISITPSVEAVGSEEAQMSALTYARGRIYPSPAQENLQKLIYRTEIEVNELYAKIESGLSTEEENREIDVKLRALYSHKKLLKGKVSAARRSMKSREKRKKTKNILTSSIP